MTITRRQGVADVLLAAVCVTVAVIMQVTNLDAVAANDRPNVLSVALTVIAVAPIAVRRRAPLAVLIACFPGFICLVATKHSVGAATLGVIIAFYTAAAWDSRRNAIRAVAVLIVGLAIALLFHPVDLGVEGLVVQLALLVGSWVLGKGSRDRRAFHEAEVAEAQRQIERERERAELERERAEHATIEERSRITRELHDVLGHAFSVMVVQAGVAEHLMDVKPGDARRALAEIGATGRASLAEMRGLLGRLREGDTGAAPRDPAPTLADLPSLLARVRAAGLAVDVHEIGARPALPAGIELAAYRVIQEALTNCLKHARASTARVDLTYDPDSLAIEVRDNGHGAADWSETPGHGLAGMRERVAIYGGDMSAGTDPRGGYVVRARLPLHAVRTTADAE